MTVAIPVFCVVWLLLVNIVLYLGNENSPLKRCVRFKGTLMRCTNKSFGDVRPQEYFAWDILDAEHATTGTVPRLVLLVYRCCLLTFFGFAILYQGLWGSGFSDPTFEWLIYFTNWTFVGFGLYGLIGIVVLVQAMMKSTDETKWMFCQKLCVILFESVGTAAIFLSMFYWAVLYDGETVELDNVMRHGINVVLMLGDLLMSRIPIVTYHFPISFIYGSAFTVFMWVYYGVSGDWVYDALDWNDSVAVVYFIAIPFLLVLSFAIVYGVAALRERFLVTKPEVEKYSSLEKVEIQMGQVANTN